MDDGTSNCRLLNNANSSQALRVISYDTRNSHSPPRDANLIVRYAGGLWKKNVNDPGRVQHRRRELRATAAAIERELTRDRAAPLACAGLPLVRIAQHDSRASPGAPHDHPSRTHGAGVSHLHGVA